MIWVGNLSSYIFVAHPIAMTIMQCMNLQIPLWALTTIYILLFMSIALIYKPMHLWLISQCKSYQ